MISPEVLRRYPFFGFLKDDQFKKVAMLAEEVSWKAGTKIFKAGEKTDALIRVNGRGGGSKVLC